jgi:hypothetical protein
MGCTNGVSSIYRASREFDILYLGLIEKSIQSLPEAAQIEYWKTLKEDTWHASFISR